MLKLKSQVNADAGEAHSAGPDWSAVVARIHKGDSSAEVELYQVFSRGIRFFISRQLGAEGLEDNVHDCFLSSVDAIRRGQVREPERLMGFVRTIVRRKVGQKIGERVEERARLCQLDPQFLSQISSHSASPESLALEKERRAQARQAVAELPEREREVLTRFYVLEQPKERICQEMNMTETQFRLVKSRTKAKLAAGTQRLRNLAAVR